MKDQEEENRGLLEEFELPTRSRLEVGRKSPLQITHDSLNCCLRHWKRWLGSLLCVLALATLVVYFRVPQELKPRTGEQLAITLHPKNHADREAITLNFDWHISAGLRAPDGVEKRVYLVNGEFPGPTIEARSGDRIVVHVHNELEGDEGISLHWHGLQMKGYNHMDGAVGFTQCPIPARKGMVYDFQIGENEHGTFWWHGHDGVQRADGLFGGLVVHAPHTKGGDEYDHDSLLMVGDWFHRSQSDVLAWYSASSSLGREPVPDSLLINGQGRYNCSMAVPARPLVCSQIALHQLKPLYVFSNGQTRIRVVNTGTIAGFTLKLDGATMRDIRVDGSYSVKADDAKDTIGILYPGERVDFVVEWAERKPSADPWLTVSLDDENFGQHNPELNPDQEFPLFPGILKALEAHAKQPTSPNNGDNILQTLSATGPSPPIPAKAQETLVFYLKTQKLSSLDNRPVGFVNHTSWVPQSPPLIAQNRSSWDAHQFVPFIGKGGSDQVRVDIILNNLDDGSHPFHLHGNSFYVLSSYRSEGRNSWGSYNPYDGSEPSNGINLDSPVRKDTVSVPRRGHIVLALVADNPGIWMLHCHMLVHMSTGMATGLHVGDLNDFDNVAAEHRSAAMMCGS